MMVVKTFLRQSFKGRLHLCVVDAQTSKPLNTLEELWRTFYARFLQNAHVLRALSTERVYKSHARFLQNGT